MNVKQAKQDFLNKLKNKGVEATENDLQVESYFMDCDNSACVNKHFEVYYNRFNYTSYHSQNNSELWESLETITGQED